MKTTSSELKIGHTKQLYVRQRRFPNTSRRSWHSLVGRSRIQQVIMAMTLIGLVCFLWIQPVAAAPTITEFHVPNASILQGITQGPDGNLWFTDFYDNVVGRITPQGKSTLFTLNTLNSATYITNGPDGALWVTLLNDVGGSTTNQIGRLTPGGKLTTFTVPRASYIWDITTGPNGKLYFTDGSSRVWSITTKGKFRAFPFTDKTGGYPYQITTGPDGNLWFTDRARLIVKMTPSGKFTTFQVPIGNATTDDIATGPDGNLWFTDQDFSTNVNAIGRITTTGSTSLFPTPTANSGPTDITAGPDGAMWFTEAVGNVGRITTT